MKTIVKKNGEHFFQIHSDVNRNLGIFLLFLGIVGSAPLYYLASIAVNQPTYDLRPAIWIGLVFVIIGFYFIFFSKKSFWVCKNKITIKDSFFGKKMVYHCDDPDRLIRLKNYEIEYKTTPTEIWELFLVSDKKEFSIHKRPNSQLEMRQLSETLAKILECPFEDLTFEEEGITINSDDLDMPYKDRVLKYPQLLGKTIKEPSKVHFSTKEAGQNKIFSWGIMTPRLLSDTVLISLLLFILSFIPMANNNPSFFQICAENKDFFVYYVFAGIVFFTIFVLSGYKINLVLAPNYIEFTEHLWAAPYHSGSIPINELEEINMYVTIRGAKVQIISDKKLIDIHLYNPENARWLVYLIRQYLLTV